MTLSEAIAQAGIDINAPIQQVAGNSNVPAPVAQIATITGNSIQYACGPTVYLVIVTEGYDPPIPNVPA